MSEQVFLKDEADGEKDEVNGKVNLGMEKDEDDFKFAGKNEDANDVKLDASKLICAENR